VVCVADDDRRSPTKDLLANISQPFLVGPPEIVLVVPSESTLVVGNGVRGVAIDEVAVFDID
jgi:hypothetical protein